MFSYTRMAVVAGILMLVVLHQAEADVEIGFPDSTVGEMAQKLSLESGIEIRVSESLQDQPVSKRVRAADWSRAVQNAFENVSTVRVYAASGELYRVYVLAEGESPVDLNRNGPASASLWEIKDPRRAELEKHFRNVDPSAVTEFDPPVLSGFRPGDRVNLDLPSGAGTLKVTDSYALEGGLHTVRGTFEEYGELYTVHLTQWEGGYFGSIATPTGQYTLESHGGHHYLVDGGRSGLQPGSADDDGVAANASVLRGEASDLIEAANLPEVTGAADTPARIDLLVLYHKDLVGGAARVRYLVDLANTALIDSGAEFLFHARSVREIDHDTEVPGLATLMAMLHNTGVFSGLEQLRKDEGYDLVTYVRPYRLVQGDCGRAYVLGLSESAMDKRLGYSVVGDGQDEGHYCHESALAHELGHNMGNAHDHTQSISGRYSYSYGHYVPAVFATVMSYERNKLHRFSNPGKSCHGLPCGIPEGQVNPADTVRGMNNVAMTVAAFYEGAGPVGEEPENPGANSGSSGDDNDKDEPKVSSGGGGGGGGGGCTLATTPGTSTDLGWLALFFGLIALRHLRRGHV